MMTRSIILGANGRYEALVSDEDYEYLTQWKWQYKESAYRYRNGCGTKGVYAKRTTTVNGRKITLLMSHVVLERMGLPRPDSDFDADHQNDHSLDNQRHNLGWVPSGINRACAKKRYAGPTYAEASP